MISKTINLSGFIFAVSVFCFTMNTETNAQSANTYIKLGKEAKNYNDRINYFSKAIKLDTASSYAYYLRGSEYLDHKKYTKAICDLSQALNYNYYDSLKIYKMRNYAYMLTDQYENALIDINKVIENRPNKYCSKDRGIIYLTLEQYDNALNDFQIWIDDCIKTGAEPQYELIGWVYIGKNEFEKAINYLNNGGWHAPKPNPMEIGQIISYYQLNQKDKAKTLLEKLIKDDPSLKTSKVIVHDLINTHGFFVIKKYAGLLETIYKELISNEINK